MKFRTEYEGRRGGFALEAGEEIFVTGSCFAESAARLLREAWFRVEANPTGVLFNPLSIASMLGDLHSSRRWTEGDLVQSNGLWVSFAHHGCWSHPDRSAALDNINRAARQAEAFLRRARTVIATFGTAWVFRRADGGAVVANCHKRPAGEFVRELASTEEICAAWDTALRGPLAGKRVILTVSPVRHLADGLAGNFLSKATLRLAAQSLADRYDAVEYFPAYEIVTDDLRDYRFYGEDLVHPTPQAVRYVWEKFAAAYLSPRTLELLPRLEKLSAAMNHRPLHPDAPTWEAFRRDSLEAARSLAALCPQADFGPALKAFGGGD